MMDARDQCDPEEFEADLFACHLLMPLKMIDKRLERLTIDRISPLSNDNCFVDMAKEFGVSVQLLVYWMTINKRLPQ